MKILVIAGNYSEFKLFLNKQINKRNYIYVTKFNWLGTHNVPIVKVGTWYERTDLDIRRIENIVNHY